MCANDHPVTARDRLLQYFGVDRPDDVAPPELAFPLSLAPFIVRAEDREVLQRECRIGQFGLLPFWAKELAFGRRTYNACARRRPRSRASRKPGCAAAAASFRPKRSTSPATRPARPCAGASRGATASRWASPACGAGGAIAVNADEHALMKRFHRPGEEKRMVVILDEAEFSAWLEAPPERMRSFMRCFPAELLEAEPVPLR